MRLIRKNVEREAEGSAAEKLISDGFTPMKKATPDTVPEEKIGKDIEDMTVEELKTLAKEKGLTGVSSLAKADLLAILKGSMASAEDIKKLKILTGEKNEELLSVLLDEAEAFVLSYTNRKQLRTGLEKAVRDLAVIALNRMGTEGEKSRSEGGESYTFEDAPKQIYDTLNRYRLARVGGKIYEAEKKQT